MKQNLEEREERRGGVTKMGEQIKEEQSTKRKNDVLKSARGGGESTGAEADRKEEGNKKMHSNHTYYIQGHAACAPQVAELDRSSSSSTEAQLSICQQRCQIRGVPQVCQIRGL